MTHSESFINFCIPIFKASDQQEALMVGKVETEQKRQAWEASLDQLHQTIREIIQAQKNARYLLLSRLPNY